MVYQTLNPNRLRTGLFQVRSKSERGPQRSAFVTRFRGEGPAAGRPRCILSMQAPIACSSFRQGITTETSGVLDPYPVSTISDHCACVDESIDYFLDEM
jgi:hypothetical protein